MWDVVKYFRAVKLTVVELNALEDLIYHRISMLEKESKTLSIKRRCINIRDALFKCIFDALTALVNLNGAVTCAKGRSAQGQLADFLVQSINFYFFHFYFSHSDCNTHRLLI